LTEDAPHLLEVGDNIMAGLFSGVSNYDEMIGTDAQPMLVG
jgi:hypothetical protein